MFGRSGSNENIENELCFPGAGSRKMFLGAMGTASGEEKENDGY